MQSSAAVDLLTRTARLEELNSPSSPKKRKSGQSKSKARTRQHSTQVNGVNNVENNLAEQVSQALIRLPSADQPPPLPAPRSGIAHAPDPNDPNSHVFDGWSQDDAFADPFAVLTAARLEAEPDPLRAHSTPKERGCRARRGREGTYDRVCGRRCASGQLKRHPSAP